MMAISPSLSQCEGPERSLAGPRNARGNPKNGFRGLPRVFIGCRIEVNGPPRGIGGLERARGGPRSARQGYLFSRFEQGLHSCGSHPWRTQPEVKKHTEPDAIRPCPTSRVDFPPQPKPPRSPRRQHPSQIRANRHKLSVPPPLPPVPMPWPEARYILRSKTKRAGAIHARWGKPATLFLTHSLPASVRAA